MPPNLVIEAEDSRRSPMRRWKRIALVLGAGSVLAFVYWRWAIPTHRIDVRSELIMLGDLDGDHRWNDGDLTRLEGVAAAPFAAPAGLVWRFDLNQNGSIEGEDVAV